MDVEKQLVVGIWVAFLEFLADAAVGGADVVGYYVAEDELEVVHFC